MFSNLEVTGVIGSADEVIMDSRRCACEDVMQKDEVMNPELQPQQFNLGQFSNLLLICFTFNDCLPLCHFS